MINSNGRIIDNSENIFNSENRGFKYGDALFETLKVLNKQVVHLEDHYFRLMASMRMLRMEIPMNFTLEFFENEIIKTLVSNNLNNARVRLTVYRKKGGLYKPNTNAIAYVLEASPFIHRKKEKYSIDLFKDYNVHSGLLSTIKTTNKLTNVLAGIYASENELDNCILLNEKKYVVEAINGNVFVVFGKIIKTPPISEGCIKGIIRKKVMEFLLKNENYTLEEKPISPFDLQKADEIFITNSIVGIQPVSNFRKKTFGFKVAKAIEVALKI